MARLELDFGVPAGPNARLADDLNTGFEKVESSVNAIYDAYGDGSGGLEPFPQGVSPTGVTPGDYITPTITVNEFGQIVTATPQGNVAPAVVYAGPASGPNTLPTFRPLAQTDIPLLQQPAVGSVATSVFARAASTPEFIDFGLTTKNIASLRLVYGPTNRAQIDVLGFERDGDGAGGQFYWDAASTETDNTGTIVNPTGNLGPGRWKRTLTKPLNMLWFGCRGNLTQYTGSAMTATFATITGDFSAVMANGDTVAQDMAILVLGAGPGGIDLWTTIVSVDSPTQLTLGAAASTTVSGVSAWIGTDNAIPAALATAATPRNLFFPPGRYGFMSDGVSLTQFGHQICGSMPMDLKAGTYPFASTHTALYAMAPISLIQNAASIGVNQMVQDLWLEVLLSTGTTARMDANTAIAIDFGNTGSGALSGRYSQNAGLQCQIRGVGGFGFREGLRLGDPQVPTKSWAVTLDRVKFYNCMVGFRIADAGTLGALSGTQQCIASACTAIQTDSRWSSLVGRYAREIVGVIQYGGFWQWDQLRSESNHVNFRLNSRPSGQQGQALLLQPSLEGAFYSVLQAYSNTSCVIKGGYGSWARGSNAAITTCNIVNVIQEDAQENLNPSNVQVEGFEMTDGLWSFGDKPRVILFTGIGFGATITATVGAGLITGVVVGLPGESYTGAEQVTITGGGGSGGVITLQVLNGHVVGGVVTNAGSGYATPPTLAIDGGSGAAGTAVICNGATFNVTVGAGIVTAVTPTAPGVNYFVGQAIVIAGDGAGATAVVATINGGGGILTCTVTAPGAGYTAATASISNGVTAITVDAGGSNYLNTAPTVVVDSAIPNSANASFTANLLAGAVDSFTRNSTGSGYSVGTVAPRTTKKTGSTLVRIEAPAGTVTSPGNVWIDNLTLTDQLDMSERIIPVSSTSFPRFAPKRISIVGGPATAQFSTPIVYEWADNRQGPTVIQGALNNLVLQDIGNEARIGAYSNDAFYTGYLGLLGATTGFKVIATIVVPPETAPSSGADDDVCGVIRLVGTCRYAGVNAGADNLIDWPLTYERVGGVWTIDVAGGNSGNTVKTGGPAGVPIIKVVEAADVLTLQVHKSSVTANADFYQMTVTHISTQPRTMRIGA